MFRDRQEAGRMLAEELKKRGAACSAVLGLIRGGMPVAFEVASALGAPLDVVAVKKLRAPFSEELAIGAICSDGSRVLKRDILEELDVTMEYLERESAVRLAEARAAEEIYRGGLPSLDISGASVVVVDDGIATGATMEAGILSARNRGANKVIAAAPVGSPASCRALLRRADDVICLGRPMGFWAVGQFYLQFPQVSDEEVKRLLEESRSMQPKVASTA